MLARYSLSHARVVTRVVNGGSVVVLSRPSVAALCSVLGFL
jgi:hypothetical protein